MKKLILLAALAAGVAYVVKFKSGQVKSAATKVTHDPRVQSALATASEKAGPVASTVSSTVSSAAASAASAVTDQLHASDELETPEVPEEAVEVAETDPVSAPEFRPSEPPKVETADIEPAEKPDPLTDPLETLTGTEDAGGPSDVDGAEGAGGSAPKKAAPKKQPE
ncbi:hypothetical protein P5P86_05840 [Nocardioides sp. BP30]|uniref:hypothetical protein n=1 Tax=Nocardioides sp. BP30 TaxID=3036374 RepID=UPI0024685E41|nr:hypothetical protein [Nocardioides sp. BP30]WGL53348.1 hypothetical protein P5P86_05840 [Nocardioides sp. BP30]